MRIEDLIEFYVYLRYVKIRNFRNMVRNPFIITPVVPEEYFCDRETETQQMCKHILNGRNVALFAGRRLGKTGLIRHCFEQKEIGSAFNTFLIDIYAASDLKEMTTLFAREVFSRSNIFGIKEKLLKGLKSIRPTIEYNELTATFSIGTGTLDIKYPDKTLEEILMVLDSLDKPSVIAVDEFQSIRNFREKNVEAYLRTLMQRCRNIIFIYTGSINHSMNNMFKSPSKPFYNSAVMMTIGVIEKDVYRDFAISMFSKFGKSVSSALVDKCYDYFSGITWYVQLMMNEAFAQTEKGGCLSVDDFDSVYDAIIAQQSFSYEDMFARFSAKQKALLTAIASEDTKSVSVTSEGFLSKYSLGSPSSVQTACNALKKNNVLTDVGQSKAITDLIFRDWLRRNL